MQSKQQTIPQISMHCLHAIFDPLCMGLDNWMSHCYRQIANDHRMICNNKTKQKKKRSNWNDEWNENTNVPSAISIGFSAAPLNRLTGTRITLIYRLVFVSFIFAWCFVVIGNWTHHYSMWVRWSVLNWSVWMLCAWSRLLLFQCVNLSSDTNRSPSSSQLHFITGY